QHVGEYGGQNHECEGVVFKGKAIRRRRRHTGWVVELIVDVDPLKLEVRVARGDGSLTPIYSKWVDINADIQRTLTQVLRQRYRLATNTTTDIENSLIAIKATDLRVDAKKLLAIRLELT